MSDSSPRSSRRRAGIAASLFRAYLPALLVLTFVAGIVGGIAGLLGLRLWFPELQLGGLLERGDAALALGLSVLLVAVGVSLLGAILGIIITAHTDRRISQPLGHLTQVALDLAAGDLDRRSNLERADEIGALSSALDTMAGRLQETIEDLEDRVSGQTQALERQAARLAAVAGIGRAAAAILDVDRLCHEVVTLVRDRFDYYYAGLFLLDEAGEVAVLKAGTGEAGRVMLARGHKLPVGGISLVGAACEQRQPRLARDIPDDRGDGAGTAETVRYEDPLLPATRSEVALPLVAGDRLLGALDVQSSRPSDLTDDEVLILKLVADQVAVAIDNANKLSHEAALLEAASPLYRASRRLSMALTADEIVQAILASVAETEADACVVGRLYTGPGGRVETAAFLGVWDRRGERPFPVGIPFPVDQLPLPLELVTAFWTADDLLAHRDLPPVLEEYVALVGSRALVNLPLREEGQVTGFVLASRSAPGPFSPASLRLYETVAEQAAAVLERARLYQDAQGRAAHERVIGEVTGRIRQTLDVDNVLRAAASEMRQLLDLAEVELRIVGGPQVTDEASKGLK